MSAARSWRFFTVGYGGRGPDDFVALLTEHGVKTVADIRATPQKAYLASFALARDPERGVQGLLARAGIGYTWLPELGNPFRHVDDWRPVYAELIDKDFARRAARLSDLIEPFALLCAEKRAADCHRSLVATRLVERGHILLGDI